jgi:hypothetical protein
MVAFTSIKFLFETTKQQKAGISSNVAYRSRNPWRAPNGIEAMAGSRELHCHDIRYSAKVVQSSNAMNRHAARRYNSQRKLGHHIRRKAARNPAHDYPWEQRYGSTASVQQSLSLANAARQPMSPARNPSPPHSVHLAVADLLELDALRLQTANVGGIAQQRPHCENPSRCRNLFPLL